MKIHQVLGEFGRQYGFGDIALNGANMARLEFEGSLAVDFEYRADAGLYLYATVAQLGGKPPLGLLRALLEANAPGQNAHGFVFSIDGASNILLSHRLDDAEIDVDSLARTLERFLDVLEAWRAQAACAADAPEAPGQSEQHGRAGWHLRA